MPVITTPRLRLRPFEDGDLDDLYEYHSRDDVTAYLYWGPRSREEVRQVIARRQAQTALAGDGTALGFAVELADAGKVIGEVNLSCVSEQHRQGEIGYVFNPAFAGKGYATEAARAMLELGFATYDFHRLIGRCDARNAASAKLMERLGMRLEAHFVENEMFKGEWGSMLVYAMLQREWAQHGAGKLTAQRA